MPPSPRSSGRDPPLRRVSTTPRPPIPPRMDAPPLSNCTDFSVHRQLLLDKTGERLCTIVKPRPGSQFAEIQPNRALSALDQGLVTACDWDLGPALHRIVIGGSSSP